ncbi:MAG: S-methyl-5-thioribose-1-phosphate isomerase [Chlorobium sp.]|jgi:methylthioribose-1-phosphate isomerase|uniref:S-methyl-5-thioribose-1-phosphate isomerase n=1 Tax=Chlorobium sp. TaxID=1095 RepID=UPI001DD47D38|nr:S-methyl-5-thioribose-1-phosphate isomerase [Chlorobium sp.]MBN1279503.1 S-methyl-5-thioribose-1-phosphate isomerase [Chlorobiaceae bacterium]MCF8215941.1 S-methyl-5-thioribose-1-phosphate isomerase [Chlorobium sp.]MCF8270839.1 S-methyl-5-thioribose-1-phosphate isomerase [Chlorobium sp.]MCF8287151.1 S-methyl-5-thioribose-1-phosphate isomerase [Chlorobium sp.]MCF8290808.1 S-methyl-5-thioribose-1-phosphate isomerase [Chlorobium sp.]
MIDAISFTNDTLRYLDQRFLPLREEYIATKNHREAIEAIKTLAVRGAPLIGVAAGYTVILGINEFRGTKDEFPAYFRQLIADVEASRPTAVNLFFATARMKEVYDAGYTSMTLESLFAVMHEAARKIHEDEIANCDAMSRHGVELIKSDLEATLKTRKLTVLTHCNTGTLATGGSGTALGVIKLAWQEGLIEKVITAESRPLLQGLRLTAWELEQEKIPYFSISDSSSAFLMQREMIDFGIVGADRIAANGDTANKIGTCAHAISAFHHNIPFYIAAPVSTIDITITDGSQIPIEERSEDELRTIFGTQVALPSTPVINYAFDVTPGKFLRGIITDKKAVVGNYSNGLKELFEE